MVDEYRWSNLLTLRILRLDLKFIIENVLNVRLICVFKNGWQILDTKGMHERNVQEDLSSMAHSFPWSYRNGKFDPALLGQTHFIAETWSISLGEIDWDTMEKGAWKRNGFWQATWCLQTLHWYLKKQKQTWTLLPRQQSAMGYRQTVVKRRNDQGI